ncbi:MAG: hypothetical protein ACOCXJ_02685 [Planctomycetota bacterium]
MHDPVDILRERFDFEPPSVYRELLATGCFDPQHPRHVQLTDLVWLDGERLRQWERDERQVPGLVPFAQTLNGDDWCWYPDIDPRLDAPVVFCPDEDEVAVLYAPDFAAFIYRALLEECTESFLVEREGFLRAGAVLADYIDTVAPMLPIGWSERLQALGRRVLRESDADAFYGVIDAAEYEGILRADIDYDRLDEEFAHLRADEERA